MESKSLYDKDSPDKILDKVAKHLRSQQSLAVDHVEFFQRRQQPGKSFDVFWLPCDLWLRLQT
jgi:hypothetical protein